MENQALEAKGESSGVTKRKYHHKRTKKRSVGEQEKRQLNDGNQISEVKSGEMGDTKPKAGRKRNNKRSSNGQEKVPISDGNQLQEMKNESGDKKTKNGRTWYKKREQQDKRQFPASNFVSSLRSNVNLIQYQPPPFSIFPPRHCNMSKMTIVRLTNIDVGVDEPLLFGAFKHYGWIENVYVSRRSFGYRRTGVAFIGFHHDYSAANAFQESGKIQLFGRRVNVAIYASRIKKTHVLSLQPELLSYVFKFFDWRTRVRLESVCKKFRNALKQFYEGEVGADNSVKECEWIGLPESIRVVLYSTSATKEEDIPTGDDVLKVPVDEGTKQMNQMLRSILQKFLPRISSIEFHNLSLDTQTVSMINNGGQLLVRMDAPHWKTDRIFLKGCILGDMSVGDFLEMVKLYGEQFKIEE